MKSLEYDETNYFHLRFALHVAGTSKCTTRKKDTVRHTIHYEVAELLQL